MGARQQGMALLRRMLCGGSASDGQVELRSIDYSPGADRIGGVPIVRSAVECHAGWALVAQSCAALPADCWADDDPEVLVARELVTKYRCSDAASDALAPYVSFPVDDLNASARPPTRTAAAPTLSPPPLPATAPPRPRAPMTRADGAPRLHPARARPAQRLALTRAGPPCRPTKE